MVRHEGGSYNESEGTLRSWSVLCSHKQDTFYEWAFWFMPYELYLKQLWPNESGWLEPKPREHST
jgi:hypothetical protein